MLKNRYHKILREGNSKILDLVPYNPFFFNIVALELKKMCKSGANILELGTGEGDTLLPIMKLTDLRVDTLDISPEMIDVSKNRMSEFADRINFICDDAHDYLLKSKKYDVIFSGWTLHNFTKDEREKLLKIIYNNLNKNGVLILLDKIYPAKNKKELLEKQCARYKKYLDKELAKAIVDHEKVDATDEYRIDEGNFVKFLKKTGFKKVEIIERLERDVILLAYKK